MIEDETCTSAATAAGGADKRSARATIGRRIDRNKSTEPGALTVARSKPSSFPNWKRPQKKPKARKGRRLPHQPSDTLGSNFARLMLKKALTLRTLASAVKRRCVNAP